MGTLIMKFGGTSVGSADAINQAAEIIDSNAHKWEQLVVVVSAMRGVTDALIQSAQAAAIGDENGYSSLIFNIQNRHHSIINQLLTDGAERDGLLQLIDEHLAELNAYCRSIHVLGEVTPRGMDTITSLGERMNARLVAAALRSHGLSSKAVNATNFVVTDNAFQNAVPIMDATRSRLEEYLLPIMKKGVVPVVTGFIGATQDRITTTLGRGGSDYTAAILADGLDADEVWTWTDVDGVMTADPRIVHNARVIPELSFSEVSELSYFGAKVLHPRTIRPIIDRDIPLWVKNTFTPTVTGTRITRSPESRAGQVAAITAIKDLSMVTVEGRGMMGVPGIAARTFAAVARQGASVLMISQASSEQSICFVIPTPAASSVIESIEEEMALELSRRDIDRVWAQEKIVILTAVGAGLRNTPGISGRIFSSLGQANINVIAIAQGSSEYSISIIVDAEDAEHAMRQIHQEAILNG
ncbi:MAG: aspartate kinase [Anaerolineales bacterium]